MCRAPFLLVLALALGCAGDELEDSETRCGQLSPMTKREVCLVPAGSYTIGCANERADEFVEQCNSAHPRRTITTESFYIDRREIDDASYQACADAGACSADYLPTTTGLRAEDAEAVCAYYGGALITTQQWEIAARGDDERPFPWGFDTPSCELANYAGCVGAIADSGSLPRGQSPFGVYDLAGNYAEYASSEPFYPDLRGGSYSSSADAYMDDWDDDGVIESWPTHDGIRTYHRHVDEDIPYLGMPALTARCAWPIR